MQHRLGGAILGLRVDGPPTERTQDPLDLAQVVAGRVQRTDDRAHARADDAIRYDAVLLEHLEHADMGDAARAAAAEHEAELAAAVGGRLGERRRPGEGTGEQEHHGQQQPAWLSAGTQ